jgi:PAS domain S-box-containing protein
MIHFIRFLKGELSGRLTRLTVWGVLPIGLLLTLAVTLQIKTNVDRLEERHFVDACHELQRALENRLDDHARVLLSGAALFNSSRKVMREEWRVFTYHLKVEKQLPGIQALGYSLLIPRAELARHIQEVRKEGFPEYRVHPVGERDLYSSIIFLEPFSGRNVRVLGYDMFSEPVRRAAMERARDTDAAAISGKVVLFQDVDQTVKDGALMYVPIYCKGMPAETVEQRRAAIVGWVYSAYRISDLFPGMLNVNKGEHATRFALAIFDGASPSPQNLLYGETPEAHDIRFKRQTRSTFNGHDWTLCFAQTGNGYFTPYYVGVWLTFIGGMFSTLLLFALFRLLMNTQSDAQRLAKSMTADLQQSKEALHRTAERLSMAVRTGGIGIWDLDVVTNRLVCDEQMFRLYNMTPSAATDLFETWHARVHPDDLQRFDEHVQLALQGKIVFDNDFRILWPDGTVRYIRGFATVLRDDSGKAFRMIGTNWDMTAHYQAEVALRESESNFRTFFETMTDMIFVATPEGRILFANSAVVRTLGYTADELMGLHLLALHPADTRQEAEALFSDMFRGEQENCPLPLVSKNGVLVPVETRIWLGKWNNEPCVFGICKNLSAEQEAQQRFERLFRYNPSLIALTTLPGRRFTDVNDAFLATLGYAREEIIGRTSAELGLFTSQEQQNKVAQQLSTSGRITGIELQVRCKDGRILDGLFYGEVITSHGQKYFLSVMTDITARKHAEMELARISVIQHELMRLATDFVNVPLERQDEAINQSLATMGQLIHADRAYLFAYDFDAGTMSNTHEWCGPGITHEIDNLQAVPNAMVPDWVATHLRGEYVHVPRVAALPSEGFLCQLLNKQGIRSLITLPLMQGTNCLGFVGFDAVLEERDWQEDEISLLRVLAELYAHFEARRATERETQALQQRLTQALDAAQAAVLAKSLFLGNMSHEIRTPLNAILGYAQIMERECHECPVKPKLKAITRSGEHLLELLTGLLELVRSEAHTITLAPKAFDFYQALEDVRLMFVRHPAAQVLKLDFTYSPEVPRFIHADPGKVRQVLANLVSNAVKFTEKGSVCLSASVVEGGSPEGDIMIAVDVTDTGHGIREDDLTRIFEVFEQAESAWKGGKGTGLGLYLSKRYARALGGDITVKSQLGAGSCFRFTFRARATNEESIDQASTRNVLRLSKDQRALRVLVVDDDSASCDMLVSMLEQVGFVVETAFSGEQALHRLSQAEPIDLVLMDKRMPDMDGYEAIARIRALPGGRAIPVVVVTASGLADEGVPALAAGANGYASKPVQREQLLAEMARVCGIQYDYEQKQPVGAHLAIRAGIDAKALECLPEEQRRQLGQALRRGDILLVRKIVETIALQHAELAAGISVLVDAYDYAGLRRLLDAVN